MGTKSLKISHFTDPHLREALANPGHIDELKKSLSQMNVDFEKAAAAEQEVQEALDDIDENLKTFEDDLKNLEQRPLWRALNFIFFR